MQPPGARLVAGALLPVTAAAHGSPPTRPPRQRTYANPIDIDYRYNFEQKNEGISYRSGADPVIVVQRGDYYLFETIGDGYWHSRDLGTWRHITPSRWPLTDIVAPAALSVRDTIYLLPSTTSPLPILMLTQPTSGRVEFYNRLLPWMTKHAGRYYLQYGAPGTEYNVYATGVYVADDPLGPFTYAPYNPVAYKPGGFVQGAGHGNTFQDVYGNWWNTGTPWIGVNWNFERRIGLHPAGFDSDGQMYVDTRFGDFPHWLPTKAWGTSEELFPGWMLLSYGKSTTASSALDGFPASSVTDENPRTFWVARQNRPGEWLTIDLARVYDVKAIQVDYADYKSGLYGTDSTVVTQFRLRASVDGVDWN